LTICELELLALAPNKKGYPTHPKSYGDYMRKMRLDCKLTQKDLSLILKVYTSTIDKWERGVTKPNNYNKNQIIQFLGFNPIQ
jgi:DNA-binding transcriptional regulator YiaG